MSVPFNLIDSSPGSLRSSLMSMCSHESIQEITQTLEHQIGAISIRIDDCNGNKAIWSWKEKTIKIDQSLMNDSEVNQAAYIIFELLNALQTPNFIRLTETSTNVDEFVRCIEQIEHESALKTKQLVKQIFGDRVEFDFKYVDQEFSYHFALDQIKGHAEWLANNYFPTQYFRGTLFHPLPNLNSHERKLLYALLYYRHKTKTQQDSSSSKFDELLNALETSSSINETHKKVLDCARDLFR